MGGLIRDHVKDPIKPIARLSGLGIGNYSKEFLGWLNMVTLNVSQNAFVSVGNPIAARVPQPILFQVRMR